MRASEREISPDNFLHSFFFHMGVSLCKYEAAAVVMPFIVLFVDSANLSAVQFQEE